MEDLGYWRERLALAQRRRYALRNAPAEWSAAHMEVRLIEQQIARLLEPPPEPPWRLGGGDPMW